MNTENKEAEKWREIAYRLYAALDDIDTASDIAKSDDKLYRGLVLQAHKRRFDICDEQQVDDLFADFHKQEDDLMQQDGNAE